ncbi:hypothetical protein [Streptomyces sp. NPDC090036]|uniref:hypothetical protein n=1 Tax=Streptomyces sp. NPDC090036 TaxID=3365926 RepID=UPI0038193D39
MGLTERAAAVSQTLDRAALRRSHAVQTPTWHGTHRLLASELGTALLDGHPARVPEPRSLPTTDRTQAPPAPPVA